MINILLMSRFFLFFMKWLSIFSVNSNFFACSFKKLVFFEIRGKKKATLVAFFPNLI
ncbi:hypothetical protein N478_20370 [Pseudoalteromonas luteoviolacea S4060-1]|uniref:Uncharacterized protein n=1 Tax=Pseudoalteromonas luteoviolacea S4060-1 TaxID=1365257 RepID=A0A162B460_9GAMM|nr:hypothetical protein N478_20370 [Pseudoalteromonas luteoviolacea S4060-1]